MCWPSAVDYSVSVRTPAGCFADADLAASRPLPGLFGAPLSYSGNFASVFKLEGADGRPWAVKCFTRKVSGLRQRYDAISRHLGANPRKFTVAFQYQAKGIRVGGQWYPIVKMDWIEGLRLNEVVEQYAADRPFLDRMGQLWLRLAAEMRDADMAHGDLQHGNVLLVEKARAGAMALRLIDYDGMWVPALAQSPPDEVGQPNYQHPARRGGDGYGRHVDHFSHLVIYTAVRCLAVGGKDLWARHAHGESLLFREVDFKQPERSRLLRELVQLPDAQATSLVSWLVLASQGGIDQVPFLPDLVALGQVRPLTAQQQAHVRRLMGEPVVVLPRPEPPPPLPEPPPQEPPRVPTGWLLVAGGAVAAAVLLLAAGVGVALWAMRGGPEPDPAPPPEQPPPVVVKKDDNKKKATGGDSGGTQVKPPDPVREAPPPRMEVGTHTEAVEGLPALLLVRDRDGKRWQTVARGGAIHTTDTLLALPGFAAGIRTKSGVGLLLRGQLDGYLPHAMPPLIAESAVVLHKSEPFDLDLTLLRGRVFLTAGKTRAKVRLRFDDEAWTLTLHDAGGEVGVELLRAYTPGVDYRSGAPPHRILAVWQFRGACEVQVDPTNRFLLQASDGKPMALSWNSVQRKPTWGKPGGKTVENWSKTPLPARSARRTDELKRMEADLKRLEVDLTKAGSIEDTVRANAVRKEATAFSRGVAISCLGALERTDDLLAALGHPDPDHHADRAAALLALRRWLSRGPTQGRALYDEKRKAGALVVRFGPEVAERVDVLLHDIAPDRQRARETLQRLARDLGHAQTAVAELAWFHLRQIGRGVEWPGPPFYNAGWSRGARERYAQSVEQMISQGRLPPQSR